MTPEHTLSKRYVSLTISDSDDGEVDLQTQGSDGLSSDSVLKKIASALYEEIRSGGVEPDMDFDPELEGTAMLVIEDDGVSNPTIDILMQPKMRVDTGEMSGAQALAMSALYRVQARMNGGSMVVGDVSCREDESED